MIKIFSVLAILFLVCSCHSNHKTGVEHSKPNNEEKPIMPNYQSIERNVFNKTCKDCHTSTGSAHNVLLNYSALISSPLELIIPGNALESGLYLSIVRTDKKRMPPAEKGYHQLSEKEIAAIKQWIDEGATEQRFDLSQRDFYSLIPKPRDYRELTLKIRTKANFLLPSPGMNTEINYEFGFDKPVYNMPLISDTHVGDSNKYFFRSFFDRILFTENSTLQIGQEKIPLTCIFVNALDNRFSGETPSPLIPQFLLKIYLVANDYSCQGPIKPGWPETGGKKENWDTYLYFEIKDPTIMQPTDALLRYRWNEYHVVLIQ